MSDRELLELAAKALGIAHSAFHSKGHWGLQKSSFGRDSIWNPITDDGDCARMEAKLSIDLEWDDMTGRVFSITKTGAEIEFYADHGGDKQAARRMASTRAAAEIGRRMKP